MLLDVLALAGSAVVSIAAFVFVSSLAGERRSLSARLTMAFVALLATQYVVGLGLLLLGLFCPVASLSLSSVAALYLAARWRDGEARRRLRDDAREIRISIGEIAGRGVRRACWVVVAGLVALQAMRGLWIPPLDWDFLTYHGPRAVFWLQSGALEPGYDAIGAWQEYRRMPIAGDLVTAWAMAVPRNDDLVPLFWTGVWFGLLVSTYFAARVAGASRRCAALAATFSSLMPAAFHHMTSGYVDNLVAAGIIGGAGLLWAGAKDRDSLLLDFGLAGLGTALAAKMTAGPFLALGVLSYLVSARRLVGRPAVRTVAVCGACLLLSGFPLVRNWVERGNPLYPIAIRLPVAGIEWPGQQLDPSETVVAMRRLGYRDALRTFFWEGFLDRPLLHNGMGPGGLAIILGALIALIRRSSLPPTAARDPGVGGRAAGNGVVAWMVAGVAFAVSLPALVLAPGLDDVRYALAAPAFCAIALARSPERWTRILLATGIAAHLPYDLPAWRWFSLDWRAAAVCAGAAALAATLVFLLRVVVARRRDWLWIAGAAGVVIAGGAALAQRPALVWRYYQAAAKGRTMNSGPIAFSRSALAHPLWRALHDAPPQTVAVAAGPNPRRTHWYIYPLFGRDFRHRLIHVRSPGTSWAASSRLAPNERLAEQASAWIAALERAGVDAVVIYPPLPRELAWTRSATARFERLAGGVEASAGSATAVLYRFQDRGPAVEIDAGDEARDSP